MVVGVQKAWSVTAASNGAADSAISMNEGQTPASLNDGVRAVMAGVKGFANQITGAKTSGGSANAQTFTSDSVAAISTAYGAGMLFCFKAGYSNSTTTPTFNADGVGAKTIKKGGAHAALAVGDITVNGVYWVAYEASDDCFLLLNPDSGPVSAQPLDPTLTAVGAASWSSGNALFQMTAADTVSLTLAPSVTSLTATETTAANFAVVAKNTNDSARLAGLKLESDRATPAANDSTYLSYVLSDSAGNQDEMVRLEGYATAVTSGAEFGELYLMLRSSGSLINVMRFGTANMRPAANDVVALGSATLGFADLFLASGGVINWNNGNFTLTHVTGGIEASGTVRGRVPRSSETGGALTSASANKKVVLATAPSIAQNVFTADDSMLLVNNTGSAMTLTQTSGTQRRAGTATTGNLTIPAYGEAVVDFTSATEWIVSGV